MTSHTKTSALSPNPRWGELVYKELNMLSAIIWSIWALLIGGGVYCGSKRLIEETPDKKNEIQIASVAWVIISVVIPFILHLITA